MHRYVACCQSTPGFRSTAVQVKDTKGLLVISTSFHDSRRSANQLKGRAGRQGDPGETLTLYDFEDTAFVGDVTMAAVKSEHPHVGNTRWHETTVYYLARICPLLAWHRRDTDVLYFAVCG